MNLAGSTTVMSQEVLWVITTGVSGRFELKILSWSVQLTAVVVSYFCCASQTLMSFPFVKVHFCPILWYSFNLNLLTRRLLLNSFCFLHFHQCCVVLHISVPVWKLSSTGCFHSQLCVTIHLILKEVSSVYSSFLLTSEFSHCRFFVTLQRGW